MAVPRPFLAPLAVGGGWALAGGMSSPATLLALFAAATALVASQEKRARAAGLAAGIGLALSPLVLAVLPVLVGTAIACGRARRLPGPFAIGLALSSPTLSSLTLPSLTLSSLTGGWAPVLHDASLWTVASPDAAGLLAALACGTAAWIAAGCSARPPSSRELDEAALLASIALPLLAPIGIEAAGLGLALALTGVRLTLVPMTMAANDNPLPLRRAENRRVRTSG